jgi:hypothetical protein
MNYDNDGCSNNEKALINNADIYDEIKMKQLTIEEIVKLQLFINPINNSVWKFKNGEMQPFTRFTYSSY